MIYEIELGKGSKFVECFDKIEQLGNFCMSNKKFYVETQESMSEIFKILDVSGIRKIDSKNYLSLDSSIVQKWCATIITNELIRDFENSERGQQAIITFTGILRDAMETEKKGGVDAGDQEDRDGG